MKKSRLRSGDSGDGATQANIQERYAHRDYITERKETQMAKDPARKYGVELAPCPFCGAEATAVTIYHRNAPSKTAPWYGYIQCTKCMANMATPWGMRVSEELVVRDAADAWNKRVKENIA